MLLAGWQCAKCSIYFAQLLSIVDGDHSGACSCNCNSNSVSSISTSTWPIEHSTLLEFNSMQGRQMCSHIWGVCTSTWDDSVAMIIRGNVLVFFFFFEKGDELCSVPDYTWLYAHITDARQTLLLQIWGNDAKCREIKRSFRRVDNIGGVRFRWPFETNLESISTPTSALQP